MIDTNEYKEAAVEVLDIIKHLDEDIIDKIPLDIITNLNSSKNDSYEPKIDYTIPLEQNNLKHTTKVILALLYRDYLCTKEEQEEFDSLIKENKNTKYNQELFNKKEIRKGEELRLVPVEVPKNIFQRIIDKLFKRN